MMFILKKLVSRVFFPLSLLIGLLLLGIFLKKRRTKFILAGVAILYLFSFSPFGYLILRPLESQYVPVSSSSLNKEVRWIVVLGGGSREDKTLSPEDRLGVIARGANAYIDRFNRKGKQRHRFKTPGYQGDH